MNQINLSQNIVFAGFWRSGTTWLQQSLAQVMKGKTVFEPIHPFVPFYKNIVIPSFSQTDLYFMRAFMPFCREKLPQDDPLYQFFSQCLRSELTGYWVRTLRNGTQECFYPQTVVKFVRGQLSRRGLSKTFNTPIVYISRDPRAVLASITRGNWGKFLRNISLKKLLLGLCIATEKFWSLRSELWIS